jgi:hypothetical protein
VSFLARSNKGNKIPDCVPPRWNETKKKEILLAFDGMESSKEMLSEPLA